MKVFSCLLCPFLPVPTLPGITRHRYPARRIQVRQFSRDTQGFPKVYRLWGFAYTHFRSFLCQMYVMYGERFTVFTPIYVEGWCRLRLGSCRPFSIGDQMLLLQFTVAVSTLTTSCLTRTLSLGCRGIYVRGSVRYVSLRTEIATLLSAQVKRCRPLGSALVASLITCCSLVQVVCVLVSEGWRCLQA